MKRLSLVFLLTMPAAAEVPLPADHAVRMERGLQLFASDVRAILNEHCVKCHGGEKTKGDFDLATRDDLLRGGAEGKAVIPFDPAGSRLLRLVRREEEPHMPGTGPALAPEKVAALERWISDGAPYDAPLIAGRKPARDKAKVSADDRQWWAFQPLASPQPPRAGHPIDAFLSEKAAEKNLALAPAAEPAVLLRRAHLTLTGLPPSPEEIAAFTANPSDEAWSAVIDRLLASPAYGERWARHWLDVARFAESSGFEHDYDREGAWHYRDWVIRAFNDDMPWTKFVSWQLAGDETDPDNPAALMATGFLGSGVFPTQITANEVERTRYDAMDDMLSTTSSAFLGLTVGCARCHDHKYDPIPVRDYYQMLTAFTTTTRSVVELETEPEKAAAARAEWEEEGRKQEAAIAARTMALRPAFFDWMAAGAPGAGESAWQVTEFADVKSDAGASFARQPDGSYLAGGSNGADDRYVFAGGKVQGPVRAIRLEALADPSMVRGGPGRAPNGNIALSRIRIFAKSGNAAEQELKIARAVADFEQNKAGLSVAASLDEDPKSGWAVDPQFGKNHAAVFTLAEPLAEGPAELRVVLEFQVNGQHNIGRPRLAVTNRADAGPEGDALPPDLAALLARARKAESRTTLSEAERQTIFDWWKGRDAGLAELAARLAAHKAARPRQTSKVLVCGEGFPPLRMHSQGADFFNETHYLKRGNTELKDGVASLGFLQVLTREGTEPARWFRPPPPGARFANRRSALASWILDLDHGAGAIAARVAVNRLWQHHFGRGIAASPNDFGRTGSLPSHPELLDWLAQQLIHHEWKLKPLHRLIMTSAAWRQSSARDAARESADPDNALFVRFVPRRLEAEALRDSLLAISGRLDPAMYGAGTKDENSRRRSIYFTVKRSELMGSMVAFDQPEPLVSQGQRPVTTVAPQALLLMNSPQARSWSEGLAERLQREAGSDPAAQIERAYLLATGRPPQPDERERCLAFLKVGGAAALPDLCQVVLSLNRTAYVE